MVRRLLPDDFIEFIQCLNSNDVRYLLVGGWAVGIYGHPRATKDIDFLVAIDSDNLEKLQKALLAFAAPPVDIERFKEKGYVIRIGSSPVQIDIINEADGIDMDDCYLRKKMITVDGTDIFVISIFPFSLNRSRSTGGVPKTRSVFCNFSKLSSLIAIRKSISFVALG
jgi:hypothetical protein